MSMSGREAALKALVAYRSRGARPEMVLAKLVKSENMEQREAALSWRITNGVLQNRLLLDFTISGFCQTGLSRLEASVLDILRLSVYQLRFLDRIPARAVVSEGVELAKKYSKHGAGFVNAVLRRVAENRMSLPEPEGNTWEERLSVLYSHPLWLVQRLGAEYGMEICERILSADNSEAPVTIQVNTMRTTPDALLNEIGPCASFHPANNGALLLTGVGDVTRLDAFQRGDFFVQDESAWYAVKAAALKPGMTVMDVCAAPGGKSFAAAVLMKNEGQVHAFDLHENKIPLILRGARRLGLTCITAAAGDARRPPREFLGCADVVLADVPCSGLGVIRKKPEIRYKSMEQFAGLPEMQLDILRGASKLVKPGGVLIYSTCTILPEENQQVVQAFLDERNDFISEETGLPAPYGGKMAVVLPFEENTDGFFICRMKRI